MKWLRCILFLRRHIKKDDVVIQVGFSLDRLYSDVFPLSWFAKKLIIVEPDPRSYFKLLKRRRLMKNNWDYVNKIVGYDQYIYLQSKIKHNNVRYGDFCLKANRADLDDFSIVNVIILTCNGSEYQCLLSGEHILRNNVKLIIANSTVVIEELLRDYGYKWSYENIGRQKLLIADKK